MSPALRPDLAHFISAVRAVADYQRDGMPMADVRLMEIGYSEREAERILVRAGRCGFIEYGVSARTGWLTDEGRRLLAARARDEGPVG